MSEEKIGQHYLAALHQAFPGVVLDEAWQTKDQLTITVKVNYLPEVVEFLYYQQGGWLSVPVSYTHLTLPTTGSLCRSRWSPYH